MNLALIHLFLYHDFLQRADILSANEVHKQTTSGVDDMTMRAQEAKRSPQQLAVQIAP